MKRNDGTTTRANVLVLADRGGARGGGGYLARRVVELGGLAITAEGDAESLFEFAITSTSIDLIIVGGSEKTEAERRILSEVRFRALSGVENLEAWFSDRRRGA